MQSTSAPATTTTRFFLGLAVPPSTAAMVQRGIDQYPQYVEHTVPLARWHLTLVFLGEVEHPRQYYSRLFKSMPQTFVPTVTLTHMGRGLMRTQLWAFGHPSPGLVSLRQQLLERLKKMRFPLPVSQTKEFIPHIRVADLFPMSRGIGLADYPLSVSFAVPTVQLYRSVTTAEGPAYTSEGTITL